MDDFDKLVNIRQKVQAEKDIMYREGSKDKLKKTISQKIRTTMIGSLNAIEKRLGFLWGLDEYGKDRGGQLTAAQKNFKDVFDTLRSDILDLGNNQIRNCDTELEQYDVKFNRYHLDLPVRPEGPQGGKNAD